MNDELSLPQAPSLPTETTAEPMTQGMSSLYKLFEAFIALREKNGREHKIFEQTITKSRDTMLERFNAFAGETQRAFQNLRQELTGEKRLAIAILNELVDVSLELEHIVAARPQAQGESKHEEVWSGWGDAVEIQSRKIQAALRKHGIHPYDAIVGTPYIPALHERVGSKHMEGMDAMRIAEQKEHGYASQNPEFVLRRPKVIVSE